MTSKEALECICFQHEQTEPIYSLWYKEYIKPIENDLDKLDNVWDKVEEFLQDELNSLVREIPYDMLNSVKVRLLAKLKEWLNNDK